MNCIVSLHQLSRRSSSLMAAAAGLCGSLAVWAAAPLPVPVPASVPVTVTNAPAIAKAEGIQHPFQRLLGCSGTVASKNCETSFDLPAHRRLVLEYVSSVCTIFGAGTLAFTGVRTTVDGAEIPFHALNHIDHPPLSSAGPLHLSIAAHPVKIYADAGTTVRFFAENSSGDDWVCSFTLSGQTIDVP